MACRRPGEKLPYWLLEIGLLLLCIPWRVCFIGATTRSLARTAHPLPTRTQALAPLTAEDLEAIKAWQESDGVLDESAEEEMIKQAAFPIPPEELIMRSKRYLAMNQYRIVEPELLADDFVFCGPVVGPLGKENFIEVLNSFDLQIGFPNNRVRWHHFRVDPFDPSRVLFTGRPTGTNTGPIPVVVPEEGGTGIKYEGPPEAASLKFRPDGKIVEYTAAYVMDKNQGNTSSMTGFNGILYGLGRPIGGGLIPEAMPWSPSPLWQLLKWLGKA